MLGTGLQRLQTDKSLIAVMVWRRWPRAPPAPCHPSARLSQQTLAPLPPLAPQLVGAVYSLLPPHCAPASVANAPAGPFCQLPGPFDESLGSASSGSICSGSSSVSRSSGAATSVAEGVPSEGTSDRQTSAAVAAQQQGALLPAISEGVRARLVAAGAPAEAARVPADVTVGAASARVAAGAPAAGVAASGGAEMGYVGADVTSSAELLGCFPPALAWGAGRQALSLHVALPQAAAAPAGPGGDGGAEARGMAARLVMFIQGGGGGNQGGCASQVLFDASCQIPVLDYETKASDGAAPDAGRAPSPARRSVVLRASLPPLGRAGAAAAALLLGGGRLAFVQPLPVLDAAAAAELSRLWARAAGAGASGAGEGPPAAAGAAAERAAAAWRLRVAPLLTDACCVFTAAAASAANGRAACARAVGGGGAAEALAARLAAHLSAEGCPAAARAVEAAAAGAGGSTQEPPPPGAAAVPGAPRGAELAAAAARAASSVGSALAAAAAAALWAAGGLLLSLLLAAYGAALRAKALGSRLATAARRAAARGAALATRRAAGAGAGARPLASWAAWLARGFDSAGEESEYLVWKAAHTAAADCLSLAYHVAACIGARAPRGGRRRARAAAARPRAPMRPAAARRLCWPPCCGVLEACRRLEAEHSARPPACESYRPPLNQPAPSVPPPPPRSAGRRAVAARAQDGRGAPESRCPRRQPRTPDPLTRAPRARAARARRLRGSASVGQRGGVASVLLGHGGAAGGAAGPAAEALLRHPDRVGDVGHQPRIPDPRHAAGTCAALQRCLAAGRQPGWPGGRWLRPVPSPVLRVCALHRACAGLATGQARSCSPLVRLAPPPCDGSPTRFPPTRPRNRPPTRPQLRLRRAALPELIEQAGVCLASISAGCPPRWAAGRMAVILVASCCATAACEIGTRRLFKIRGRSRAAAGAPGPAEAPAGGAEAAGAGGAGGPKCKGA